MLYKGLIAAAAMAVSGVFAAPPSQATPLVPASTQAQIAPAADPSVNIEPAAHRYYKRGHGNYSRYSGGHGRHWNGRRYAYGGNNGCWNCGRHYGYGHRRYYGGYWGGPAFGYGYPYYGYGYGYGYPSYGYGGYGYGYPGIGLTFHIH